MSSTTLLTDRYEPTMLQAALADGTAHRRTLFEVLTHTPDRTQSRYFYVFDRAPRSAATLIRLNS